MTHPRDRRFHCSNCGGVFPAWEYVTRRRTGYVEHPDSYIRHLLDNPECNTADAERRALIREELRQDDPWDY